MFQQTVGVTKKNVEHNVNEIIVEEKLSGIINIVRKYSCRNTQKIYRIVKHFGSLRITYKFI